MSFNVLRTVKVERRGDNVTYFTQNEGGGSISKNSAPMMDRAEIPWPDQE